MSKNHVIGITNGNAGSQISDEIRRFITANINSIEQLEVLLLLHGEPQTVWSAEAVSRRLCTSPASALARLQNLQARGFLSAEPQSGQEPVAGGLLFRYTPHSQAEVVTIQQLGHVYRERKDAIINLIF